MKTYRSLFIFTSLILVFIIVYVSFFQNEWLNQEKNLSSDPYIYKFHSQFPSSSRHIPSILLFNDREDRELLNVKNVLLKWKEKSVEATEWGEHISGVKNRLDTEEKVVALTFDACGGPSGNGYDEELIQFLMDENIPATLFMNGRWIEDNEEIFRELNENDLFTIENHGTHHVPLSINGLTAWGIQGTKGVEEIISEVMENQELVYDITGKYPSFFRSGTAFYDEVAVQIVEDLGLTAVNYNILGDAGATFSSNQVKNALLSANPGSIALLHMNHPSSGTAQGVMEAVPILKERGYQFVHLDAYALTEDR